MDDSHQQEQLESPDGDTQSTSPFSQDEVYYSVGIFYNTLLCCFPSYLSHSIFLIHHKPVLSFSF